MIIKDKNYQILLKIILIFLIFISLVIALTSIVSYNLALRDANNYLSEITQRVKEDIKYSRGSWDTTQYKADSNIPDNNPLYIISSNGYVIERKKPIRGLLDIVDYTRLNRYDEPTSIKTITNENWRILSKPIKYKESVIGVIAVTAYISEFNNQAELDKQLELTLEKIESQLRVNGDDIDTTFIDERYIPYNITFQIVNKYNQLLFHNSNTSSNTMSPSFIDRSYIGMQLKQQNHERIVKDSESGKEYMVLTVPINDQNKSTIGIVVAGYPIDKIYSALYVNILIFIASSLIVAILLLPVVYITINKYSADIIRNLNKINIQVNKISFNKDQSKIIIDDKSIDIPYASFQYYFCLSLFSKPYKKWETDELLDKFDEQLNKNNWRKVYDAMTALNRKTESILHDKLFVVKNKTFKINPIYADKIALKS